VSAGYEKSCGVPSRGVHARAFAYAPILHFVYTEAEITGERLVHAVKVGDMALIERAVVFNHSDLQQQDSEVLAPADMIMFVFFTASSTHSGFAADKSYAQMELRIDFCGCCLSIIGSTADSPRCHQRSSARCAISGRCAVCRRCGQPAQHATALGVSAWA